MLQQMKLPVMQKPVKRFLLFMTFSMWLFSCNQADKTKVAAETTTEVPKPDTIARKTEREILIDELKRLKAVFASKDKEKIADLFSFPVDYKTVGIFIEDSSFNAQYEKNGDKATRAMFLKYYRDISESLQIGQINQLFKHLNIDNLLHKDTLDYDAIIKTEPCYHNYGITINKNQVTLTLGSNSNREYKSKKVAEDEIPENASEICEHVLWWKFRFDGKRLHLKEITGAG
jgi:hypothetical protein